MVLFGYQKGLSKRTLEKISYAPEVDKVGEIQESDLT